jgi:hypothetical protein
MAAKDQYLSISVHFQALPHRQGWQPQLGWGLTGLPQYGLRVIAVNDHISVAGKSQEHASSFVSKWGGESSNWTMRSSESGAQTSITRFSGWSL